ncbi:polysaccharide deacetylase family protein [Butyrivibrio sp. ob235]|uniref:polysaccharide deacetylase family protein n=2 Tax=unclassified Butyrivibrio TaxID=2639466 RepID=UPI0015870F15|nr:polysaccharide deacetylase family protein [Butyrivibrio sp. ob235]
MIRALLTMDDFSTRNTPAIVDYLEEKNIPVIMFAWGQNVEQYHDETEEMVPGYYKQFLDECLMKGVEFVAPKFK